METITYSPQMPPLPWTHRQRQCGNSIFGVTLAPGELFSRLVPFFRFCSMGCLGKELNSVLLCRCVIAALSALDSRFSFCCAAAFRAALHVIHSFQAMLLAQSIENTKLQNLALITCRRRRLPAPTIVPNILFSG